MRTAELDFEVRIFCRKWNSVRFSVSNQQPWPCWAALAAGVRKRILTCLTGFSARSFTQTAQHWVRRSLGRCIWKYFAACYMIFRTEHSETVERFSVTPVRSHTWAQRWPVIKANQHFSLPLSFHLWHWYTVYWCTYGLSALQQPHNQLRHIKCERNHTHK